MIYGNIAAKQPYTLNLPTIEEEHSSLEETEASSDHEIDSPIDTKVQKTSKLFGIHPNMPSLRIRKMTKISPAHEKRIAELFAKKERLLQERESQKKIDSNSQDITIDEERSIFPKDDSTNTNGQAPAKRRSLKDRIALQRIPHSTPDERFAQRLMNMSYCVPSEELQKESIRAINNLDACCKHKHYIDPDIQDWSESKITKLHNWLGSDYGFNVQTVAKVVMLSSFILSFGIIYLLMLLTYAITDLSSIEKERKRAS